MVETKIKIIFIYISAYILSFIKFIKLSILTFPLSLLYNSFIGFGWDSFSTQVSIKVSPKSSKLIQPSSSVSANLNKESKSN